MEPACTDSFVFEPATKSITLPSSLPTPPAPPTPPPPSPFTPFSLSAPLSKEHSEVVVSTTSDERSNELKDQRRNQCTDTLCGADSAPQSRKHHGRDLSTDSNHATAGEFETKRRDIDVFETKRNDIDKNESQKVVEKQTISLEGAPMLVQGIYSVRDVQLALNNVKANATVVGSSNVVIVFSTRKGAYFTCAKDKKGT